MYYHLQGGNLMFAFDSPKKRAAICCNHIAIMTDMILGRWSHRPPISTSFCRSFFIYWTWRPAKPKPRTRQLMCSRFARLPQSHVYSLVCFDCWRLFDRVSGILYSNLPPIDFILPLGELLKINSPVWPHLSGIHFPLGHLWSSSFLVCTCMWLLLIVH